MHAWEANLHARMHPAFGAPGGHALRACIRPHAWWPCWSCTACMHASGRTLVALLHAMAALHASGLAHLLARHYQHAMRPCMQYYYTNEVNRNVTVLISTNHVLH